MVTALAEPLWPPTVHEALVTLSPYLQFLDVSAFLAWIVRTATTRNGSLLLVVAKTAIFEPARLSHHFHILLRSRESPGRTDVFVPIMFSLTSVFAVVAAIGLTRAHTVITYPGWRGDSLHTNGTPPAQNPNTIGVDFLDNGTLAFPYGMQWIYPCGGMPLTQNRTKWPVKGGAVSVQPGWFPGHSKALIYVNIGIQGPGDLNPPNMSHPVVPPFQITGPTNLKYDGQFCLPQVPMPANLSLEIGTNITLQVIEAAQHGAALYSCVDLTLADPSEVAEVNSSNCYNSSDIGFNLVFTSQSLTAGASSMASPTTSLVILTALVLGFGSLL
ncbi:Hypothetical protein R9X50_00783700 [Acrodontium crateriforme]|uniref:Copper acquisition factor BIM1-like domain-containing protein n=1 Tax=Acrodontium crateriforme TaxID=150365 RepID=A0AAQ3MBY8_9PEZI|nr:Hypothetical protein R9X50_00783700 [Acrodontium crateriforme]